MTNKIKVLLIGYQPPPVGGVTILFNQLVEDLRLNNEVSTEVVNMSTNENGFFSKIRVAISVILTVIRRAHDVDVVSFHGVKKSTIILGPILLAVTKISGVPFILRKFGGSFDEYYQKSGRIVKLIINKLVAKSSVVLFETKELVSFFDSIPKSDVRWFPNSRPIKEDVQSSNEAQNFVFLSQIKTQKGVAEVFEAANQVPDSVTIDIFGPAGYDISEDELQNFVNNSRATYHGAVRPDQVISTLQKYDCLVLPTYWPHEGYPGVIIEAYMAGLPVITTEAGAIPEIVDESSGMFVEAKNVKDLTSSIIKLHSNPELHMRLQRGVQEKASLFKSVRWSNFFVEVCEEKMNQSNVE
jgi:glycosyltransferase involved in cell wall biosynthesis